MSEVLLEKEITPEQRFYELVRVRYESESDVRKGTRQLRDGKRKEDTV